MTTLALHIGVIHGMRKRGMVSDRRIRFIPILVKLRPGDLVSPLKTENRLLFALCLPEVRLRGFWLPV
jgi:hypothetical protein